MSMSDARELLTALRRAGVLVQADGAEVVLRTTEDRFTPAVVDAVRGAKSEILGLLWTEHLTTAPRPDLADDSPDWTEVLEWSYEHLASADFGTLRGLRCMGARIHHRGDTAVEVIAHDLLNAWGRVEAAGLAEVGSGHFVEARTCPRRPRTACAPTGRRGSGRPAA